MHVGNYYTFKEVVLWTRRDLFTLLLISAVPTCCYILLDWKWLALPWLPIALLGTAVAFVIGFKNNSAYDRVWEARKIWGGIVNTSRTWGISIKDFVTTTHAATPLTDAQLHAVHLEIFNRHFAWLTALRFQLREPRSWEAINKPHNAEYKNKWFVIEEHTSNLAELLQPYLSEEEFNLILGKSNKAAQILALQSAHLRKLLAQGLIEDFRHMELQSLLGQLYDNQGAAERIKNFPYPRQYTTLNLWFIKMFVFLLPLGMLQEFEKLGGCMVWLAIPFSALSGWIFTTLEKIGEASESPFEGSANDVPITQLSRMIEIDLREMINDTDIPQPLKPHNNIIS